MDKKTLATLAIGAGIGYYVASSSSTQGTRKKEVRREVVVGPPSGSGPSVDAGGRVVVGKPTSSARSSAARDELQITITDVVFRAEQCFGSLAATVDAAGKTRSYAEFGRRVKALGLAISKELKAPAGARVAILALNSEAYLETYFGVPFSQCLIVPCNTRLAAAETAQALNDCTCEVLIVDETFLPAVETLRSLVPSLKSFVLIGDAKLIKKDTGVVEYEGLISRHLEAAAKVSPFTFPKMDSNSPYGLFYTGGTTGRSKGVILSHLGLIFNAYSIIPAVRYGEGVRYLHIGPMFHLADGASTFAVTMTGGTHAFVPKFTPDALLRAVQELKVTHTILVPTMFQLTLQAPNLKDFELRSMRYFIYGASPMPEKILGEAMKAFPSAKFVQGYGMTETSPLITLLGAEHHVPGSPVLGSVGKAVPHAQVRILDEKDNETLPGEIAVKGPHVMLGYYNNPQATASALKNGWMHTGDGGKMDEDGFIFIVDRLKDMIVSGGENVYSSEVENCIVTFPGVLGAAVIGIPDPVLVEKVLAFVLIGKDNVAGITPERVIEFCKSKIASFKCPKEVVIRTEPFPLSGAGKVLKSVLREPYWRGQSNKIYSANDDTKTNYV